MHEHMTGKDVEEHLKALLGTDRRGWQSAVADLLDVTPRTIARNCEEPTREFISKIAQYNRRAGLTPRDVIADFAGGWTIGRAVSADCDDVFVTHIASPSFILQASFNASGDHDYYVTWIEQPEISAAAGLIDEAIALAVHANSDNSEKTADRIVSDVIRSGRPANEHPAVISLISNNEIEKLTAVLEKLRMRGYSPSR